jgi:hypothetical protein
LSGGAAVNQSKSQVSTAGPLVEIWTQNLHNIKLNW